MNIFEGGNVFKDEDGRSVTQRINQTDVKSTLAWLEELVPGLDLQNNTLGSTGIKDTSGDLDIAVDTAQVTKEQMVAQLAAGHRATDSDPTNGCVSPELLCISKHPSTVALIKATFRLTSCSYNNVPWSKFVLGAMPADSKYKGRERNVLMNSA
jgi:hypothetical protein